MLKNDVWIRDSAEQGMITPFEPTLIRKAGDRPLISYGSSSYGYDLRLCGGTGKFRIFRHVPGTVVDPKKFNPQNLEDGPLYTDQNGDQYYILPGRSYGLGVAVERLQIPPQITCIFIGKSTYARCGVIANLTPGEAGWAGFLTIELSNSSEADCRIYCNEGIIQALFLEGEPCQTTYEDRAGKYQNQPQSVVLAKV